MIQSGPGDVAVVGKKLSSLSQLSDVFLKQHRCLRTGLLLLLDEMWNKTCFSSESLPCQFCLSNPRILSLDVSIETKRLLSFLATNDLLSLKDLFNILLGTHHDMHNDSLYGSLRHWTNDLIRFFLDELHLQHLIRTVYDFQDDLPMPFTRVTAQGHTFVLDEDASLVMKFPEVVNSQPFVNDPNVNSSRPQIKQRHQVVSRRFNPKKPKKSKETKNSV